MNIEQIVDFAQANSAPEHYSPAPEKILKGDPKQSVRNHYGSPCGRFNAGIWEGAVGQWTVNYTEHEYCEIIQGVSVLRDRHGNAKTVRAGDRRDPCRLPGHLGSARSLSQGVCDLRSQGLSPGFIRMLVTLAATWRAFVRGPGFVRRK